MDSIKTMLSYITAAPSMPKQTQLTHLDGSSSERRMPRPYTLTHAQTPHVHTYSLPQVHTHVWTHNIHAPTYTSIRIHKNPPNCFIQFQANFKAGFLDIVLVFLIKSLMSDFHE